MKRSLAVFLILVISFQISYSNLLKTTNYNEVQINKNLKTETINEIADPFIENNSKDIIIKETNSAPYNRQELDLIKKIELQKDQNSFILAISFVGLSFLLSAILFIGALLYNSKTFHDVSSASHEIVQSLEQFMKHPMHTEFVKI